MKLSDKVAIVTGGASGIGKATVMEFARCGATVICADVDERKGAEVEKEAKQTNFAVEFVAINLADQVSIRSSAAAMLAKHPRIDILVNAAGWNDIQPFIENTPDYMDRVIAINLGGPAASDAGAAAGHDCRRQRQRSSMSQAMPDGLAAAARPLMPPPKGGSYRIH